MNLDNLEVLSPAGSFESLRSAVDYGADAVYLGGKDFSLRTFADNFTEEEMREGISFGRTKLRYACRSRKFYL